MDAGVSHESLCWAAAFHEAGHAVVALASGKWEVHFVILHVRSSRTDFSVAGYTETMFASEGTLEEMLAAYGSPEMLRERAVQLLAGPAAEWIARRDPASVEDMERGGEGDDKRAVKLAYQAVGADGCLAYFHSCNDDAHRLVRAHWWACCAVAEHLLNHPNEQMPGTLVAQFMSERPAGTTGGTEGDA